MKVKGFHNADGQCAVVVVVDYARFVSGEMQVPPAARNSSAGHLIRAQTTAMPGWITWRTKRLRIGFSGGNLPSMVADRGRSARRARGVCVVRVDPDEVWDVTDPLEVKRMALQGASGNTVWKDVQQGEPKGTAFRWNAVNRPSPWARGEHQCASLTNVDHVIVSTPALMPLQTRCDTSRRDWVRVAVVPQQDVFNAFSAGFQIPPPSKC